jgi:multidrug efflux pump subunit AcrB
MIQRKHVMRGFGVLCALTCAGAALVMWITPRPLPLTALVGLVFCFGILSQWCIRKAEALG